MAVASVIAAAAPDILVLQNVDFDHDLHALRALRDVIGRTGPHYPHIFALRPNSGVPSGADIDGDGRLGEPEDRQGFGFFSGQGGMAILSRYPFESGDVRDFSALLWKDLPAAMLPEIDGRPFMPAETLDVLRLASVAHWVVPVRVGGDILSLLAFHASPPVFDGPEDRNGRRNHDQLRFWTHYLNGAFGPPPGERFILIGDANLDPVDGDGRKPAILDLLGDPRLKDTGPRRAAQVSPNPDRQGDPAFDTVAWPRPDPGHLRVSYILVSTDLALRGSGIYWPQDGSKALSVAETASRHRLIWADIETK